MTTTSIAGWVSCLAAGTGSVLFLTTVQEDEAQGTARPSVVQAAISPSEPNRLPVSAASTTSARETLQRKVEMLERGRDAVLKTPGYTARFTKQEVVDGELLDQQVMLMKCRHQPFSIYLTWQEGDVGREVLYVDGANGGKLLGHDGGWKSKLPSLSLRPDSRLAMRDTRYPVTDAGLAGLAGIMLGVHHEDLRTNNVASCTMTPQQGPNHRSCYEFTTHYKNVDVSPTYRKSVTLIDEEWSVPIETRHYGWSDNSPVASDAALDDATLIEAYRFDDVDFQSPPQDTDFDRANPQYHF